MEAMGSRSRAPHRHKKLRWEYTGVLTKQPSKTALKRSAGPPAHAPTPLDPPLVASFLSDASMATSHSQTTAASSNDPQTPTTPRGVITQHPVATTSAPAAAPRPRRRSSVDTDELARVGRVAKKRVEALAQRDALVGRWRKRRLDAVEQLLAAPPSTPASSASSTSSASSSSSGSRRRRRADSARVECQVLDFKSRRRDEYKMLARMNIAGSLRELMGVLATDNAAHFHRAMAALFGAQYLTGENVAASESVGMRRARSTSARLSKALLLASRRQSTPAMRPMSASAGPASSSSASAFGRSSASFSNIKVALNAVTLQQRNGLFRRQLHDWQFLDYLDENVDAMTVTRVLQTVNSSSSSSSSSSSGPRRRVGDVFAGYVIREDREAQFTRVFFYGEARTPSGKVAKPAKKLLRGMVETLCRLVATVERQRLSALYRQHRGSESVPVAASRCFACNASFGLSAGRRRYACACCRESVCRQCLEEREIETGGDGDGGSAATKALAIGPPVVQRVRVCRGCVDRVSLPTLAAARSGGSAASAQRRPSDLDECDERESDDDDDDVIVVDACSDVSSYHWE